MSDLHGKLMSIVAELVRAEQACQRQGGTANEEICVDAWDTLSAALREVAADAARYRWLREEEQSVPGPCAYAPWAGPPLFGEELDAAIDSARSTR
jgi:hypothetical protein